MVIAIAATLGAAGLVLFLQHRAISALQSQTDVILGQISEQTAADVATELHRMLDGPVFDTLTAVNHPELRAGRLDLVAQQYERGLKTYPHVDRFFVWLDPEGQSEPPEVLFYSRPSTPLRAGPSTPLTASNGFSRDPVLGRAILDLAKQHGPTQQIYVAAEGLGADRRQQVLLRVFWNDARRVDYFAVLGFVIDAATTRQRLFAGLRPESLLARRGGDVLLQL